MWRRLPIQFALVVVLLLPAVAAAQTEGTFRDLGSGLPRVAVLDVEHHEIVGRLLSLTARTIVIGVGTERRSFNVDRIERLQWLTDSVKNGAIIGAVAGAPIGLALLRRCTSQPGPPPNRVLSRPASCPGERTSAALFFAGAFSAGGAAIDAAITGRTTFWIAPAHGASRASEFDVVALSLPVVYVTDRSGHEVTGRLVRVSDTDIVLETDGTPRTFVPADVWRIERRGDSLRNGAISGAAVGGAFGVLTAAAEAQFGPCHERCGAAIALSIASFVGLGAAVGVSIDALHAGRTTLWARSPRRDGRVSFGIGLERGGLVTRAQIQW